MARRERPHGARPGAGPEGTMEHRCTTWSWTRLAIALLAAPPLLVALACGGKPAPQRQAPAPQRQAPAAPRATAAPAPAGRRNPPADHTKDRKGVRHKSGSKQAAANCGPCHGADLRGGAGPSCYACHGQEWH